MNVPRATRMWATGFRGTHLRGILPRGKTNQPHRSHMVELVNCISATRLGDRSRTVDEAHRRDVLASLNHEQRRPVPTFGPPVRSHGDGQAGNGQMTCESCCETDPDLDVRTPDPHPWMADLDDCYRDGFVFITGRDCILQRLG